ERAQVRRGLPPVVRVRVRSDDAEGMDLERGGPTAGSAPEPHGLSVPGTVVEAERPVCTSSRTTRERVRRPLGHRDPTAGDQVVLDLTPAADWDWLVGQGSPFSWHRGLETPEEGPPSPKGAARRNREPGSVAVRKADQGAEGRVGVALPQPSARL